LRKRNSFNEPELVLHQGITCPLSFDNVCDSLDGHAGAPWRLSELVEAAAKLRAVAVKEASRMQR